jgi:hypothetical protein
MSLHSLGFLRGSMLFVQNCKTKLIGVDFFIFFARSSQYLPSASLSNGYSSFRRLSPFTSPPFTVPPFTLHSAPLHPSLCHPSLPPFTAPPFILHSTALHPPLPHPSLTLSPFTLHSASLHPSLPHPSLPPFTPALHSRRFTPTLHSVARTTSPRRAPARPTG